MSVWWVCPSGAIVHEKQDWFPPPPLHRPFSLDYGNVDKEEDCRFIMLQQVSSRAETAGNPSFWRWTLVGEFFLKNVFFFFLSCRRRHYVCGAVRLRVEDGVWSDLQERRQAADCKQHVRFPAVTSSPGTRANTLADAHTRKRVRTGTVGAGDCRASPITSICHRKQSRKALYRCSAFLLEAICSMDTCSQHLLHLLRASETCWQQSAVVQWIVGNIWYVVERILISTMLTISYSIQLFS